MLPEEDKVALVVPVWKRKLREDTIFKTIIIKGGGGRTLAQVQVTT